jgi:hypothetical protein
MGHSSCCFMWPRQCASVSQSFEWFFLVCICVTQSMSQSSPLCWVVIHALKYKISVRMKKNNSIGSQNTIIKLLNWHVYFASICRYWCLSEGIISTIWSTQLHRQEVNFTTQISLRRPCENVSIIQLNETMAEGIISALPFALTPQWEWENGKTHIYASFRHPKPDQSLNEEWCLLGCYAVWLL